MNTAILVALAVIGVLAAIGIVGFLRRKRVDQDPEAHAERMREDAKRFAKLLVSEVKLYNERQLAEGREQHDLYTRLRKDIDHARAIYEKRVNWLGVDRDYFHEAVVDVLCDGEPERLGAEYPGPRMHTVQ